MAEGGGGYDIGAGFSGSATSGANLNSAFSVTGGGGSQGTASNKTVYVIGAVVLAALILAAVILWKRR